MGVEPEISDVQKELIVKEVLALRLKRNSKCPCKSGKKVKVCHPNLLQVRNQQLDRKMFIDNQLARHNSQADSGKSGIKRMNRQEFIEFFEQQLLSQASKAKD